MANFDLPPSTPPGLPASSVGPTRREFLGKGSAMAALLAGGVSCGQSQNRASDTPAGSVSSPEGQQSLDPAVWLLRRATFGYNEEDLASLQSMGWQAWLDGQLNPNSIEDSQLDTLLQSYGWTSWSAPQLAAHPTLTGRELAAKFQEVRVLRAIHSRRQLNERMVEFWTDHFTTFSDPKVTDSRFLKIVEDRAVIRSHSLGYFSDLLHSSAKSAAMVLYLDSTSNKVGSPNENYAREIMELHTLGVTGPFTETDVRELARCFTGWDFVNSFQASIGLGTFGDFAFKINNHDTNAKSVLGLNIPAGGGISDAETVIDHLATHSATADYVTRKLARWLLSYDPPAQVINAAVATWQSTGGLIKEVVRTLLSPDSMRVTNPWRAPKFKRPLHLAVSMIRGLKYPAQVDARYLGAAIRSMGQGLFERATPDGYPDSDIAWAGLLQSRWDWVSRALGAPESGGITSGFVLADAELLALLQGAPHQQLAARLNTLLCGGSMPASEQQRIQTFVNTHTVDNVLGRREALELVANSPSFHLY